MGLIIKQASGIKSGQNVNTVNASFASLPSVGNAAIILISGWNPGDLAFAEGHVFDNQGNGNYSLAKSISNNTGHGAACIFYLDRIQTSAGTFTVTVGSNKAASNWFDFAMLEITGFNGKLRLGSTNGAIGGSPSQPDSGSISPADDENLIIGVHEIASAEGTIVVEVTSPVWTQQFEQLSFVNNSPGEGNSKIVGPGTYNAKWTDSVAAQWAAVIASFRSVGGPPVRIAPPVGSVTVLTGNVIYATPPRAINIEYLTTGAAILEGSMDAVNWVTLDTAPGAGMRFVSGVVAPYIRPSVDITVVFRKTKAKL